MLLTEKHIKNYAIFYLICFLTNYAWFIANGLLFSTLKPVFFLNRLDITGNILMLTNLQFWLTHNQWLRMVFDGIYLLLPCLLVYACYTEKKFQTLLAVLTALASIIYNYFFSMMSFVSIEVFVAWMFVPLIFIARSARAFYFGIHTVRLLFILFFFSTALWKIRGGGAFNSDQMSGILFSQHTSLLITNETNLFSRLINFLVSNQKISYIIYLLAVILEFLFVAGFFTKKFDRFLIIIFCLFIFFDYYLMEINYFTWVPFLGCLYFSRHTINELSQNKLSAN